MEDVKKEKADEREEREPPAKTSRPRRNAQKNVLYYNEDFEVSTKDLNAPSTSQKHPVPTRQTNRKVANRKDSQQTTNGNDNNAPILEKETTDEEEKQSEDDEEPPSLEVNPRSKKRGRIPGRKLDKKKPEEPTEPKEPPLKQQAMEQTVPRAFLAARHGVKLFHSELNTTPDGDVYATVITGCLTELIRKERIIELLTNEAVLFETEWMISKPPRLPPLTTEAGVFAFYIDGRFCKNAKDISFDDLRPWSMTSDASIPNSINIKPNVRRHPVALLDGRLTVVKHETRLAVYHLTEYSARLPREERLKKKIFYLTRNNCIYGNVLILYNYTRPGDLPSLISAPHGNDLLRNAAVEEIDDGSAHESPFENEPYEGMHGGYYLKLRPNKLGWNRDKQHLLDCLTGKDDILGDYIEMNNQPPDLPPLIESVGVFVYFVRAEHVFNHVHHTTDGLSPWTTIPDGSGTEPPGPRVRSTRKSLIYRDGVFQLPRDQNFQSEYCLVETMSTLARCRRIRKKVTYIQKRERIVGNVCYIYEFICKGPLPDLYSDTSIRLSDPKKRWRIQVEEDAHFSMQNDSKLDLVDEDDDFIFEDVSNPQKQVNREPEIHPDMPPGGIDNEFNDDPDDDTPKNVEPYYEEPRQLSTGHVYLTVRHRKMVTSVDTVLEWIVNSNQVEERGILNDTKPLHPPMVINSRAYAFFVAASAIFPHDINRDDFSPWSHNSKMDNPVNYRTKVKKYGVFSDSVTSNFMIKDQDYKTCPFHLVFLYSINPRDPRLRKKIYYMMETQSKMVVSHALIIYDYASEGPIVKLNTAEPKPHLPRSMMELEETPRVEDRDDPFDEPDVSESDGSVYMKVIDSSFWNDRNRHVDYLVNRPDLVSSINNKIPDLPPPCTGKGTFVYFINGQEINYRNLTVDRLCPWSENAHNNPFGITKRPKSWKVPLGLNSDNQLRAFKTTESASAISSDYQLHTYTATLPRCTRLRKKIVYVRKNDHQVGNALIMYQFTEDGPIPQPSDKYISTSREGWMENAQDIVIEGEVPQTVMEHEMIVEDEIVIEDSMNNRNYALEKTVANTGFVRGSQRYEALWRIAQKQFDAQSQEEAFDGIFKLLFEKNEDRLLQLINMAFNVSIIPENEKHVEDHVHFEPSRMQLDEQDYNTPPYFYRNVPAKEDDAPEEELMI
ncbi:hypothetical protein CAEBREN_01175 [Caenorhabditis brenneri]|uniref:DUF7747 domain-containing protein n=1 Tax=Caenorhabditis brenneri TaxID=135651 RepID=G0NIG7_CAEBE|nr:hypothetical protein CAEBREN_01175 [Caenorhabditis brenneri]